MDQRIESELQRVLQWAEGAKASAARRGGFTDGSCYGYVGGVLATLLHLDHVTEEEFFEWQDRLLDALGPPPGGIATIQ